LTLALLSGAALAACERPGGPGTKNELGDDPVVFLDGIRCKPAVSAEPLPPRGVVTDPGSAVTGADVYSTAMLFQRIGAFCAACHDQGQNGFSSVTRNQDWSAALARIQSDDPSAPGGFMPPPNAGGKSWSARQGDPNDALVEVVRLLQLWLQQGKPSGQFYLNPSATDGGTADGAASEAGPPDAGAPSAAFQADYSLPPSLGEQLTNIGTCVPNRYVVGINATTMDAHDAFFAQATELPDTLAETDLTTFDSDSLARDGVVSFVPAYPLWSDAAAKMRHLRPPRGQPIRFDKANQKFEIPPNTRFYKTFFKKIVQADGSEVYRKLETRLIVARPDRVLADGTAVPTALFGTYLWDDAETKAVLLKDPLHDGKPFADRVITYVVDEPRAKRITEAALRAGDDVDYALDVQNPGVRRHYGIPSSERCISCHMGSPSASFVLGFTPLQLATVAPGHSGVIETASGDELTQLQRFIDYKVVTDISTPAEVTPLERSQLPRAARNEYEIVAQAYLLGNCAHCHNPRGFPSVKAPELRDVLNFLPGPDGGIFQFPLERSSPVRARGLRQDIPIPYITPSLRDLPDDPARKPKYMLCADGADPGNGWCATAGKARDYIEAPWRSLIYRNVDTPFDYVDDYTIFPHMPMNTPSYDCRAPQILGDWMVSIPASFVIPNAKQADIDNDATPQPYVEVLPGDSKYATAVSDAKKRLATYHAGHRYGFCPDTSDLVDPAVLSGQLQTPADAPVYDTTQTPEALVMPADGVPNRPHWVPTDATDPPGDWLPRGGGWGAALLMHAADASGSGQTAADAQEVVSRLADVRITAELRAALTAEVPFGLWKQKPGCDFSGVPRGGDFKDAARPLWMDASRVAPDAPVYMQSAGEAVFTNICVNCHGPNADAKGLLADEISILTGGDARVANFRTGLFGPLGQDGANRARVFGAAGRKAQATDLVKLHPDFVWNDDGASADDYGARYLSWMALGGTKKRIPNDLLTLVAVTPVVGQARSRIGGRASANMLQLAQELCSNVLVSVSSAGASVLTAPLSPLPRFPISWTQQTALIGDNGDAELWMKLCTLGNRPVVRVVQPAGAGSDSVVPWEEANHLFFSATSLYWGADAQGVPTSPAGAQFLDQRGNVTTGIPAENVFPICVAPPSAEARASADAFLDQHRIAGNLVPYCAPELFADKTVTDDGGNVTKTKKWRLATSIDGASQTLVTDDANRWAIRGAINAGVAVFLYIDGLARGEIMPKPPYNQCERIGVAGAR
jgi:mono/diheme cytochrome c family protein